MSRQGTGGRRALAAVAVMLCAGLPMLLPSGYHRSAFGGWISVAGCDTREHALERAAGAWAADLDGDGCRDDAAVTDFYTGALLDPRTADVDHVWALEHAWYAGAEHWDRPRRVAFANDPRNLAVTSLSINRSKGSRGPSQWRPPTPEGACRYSLAYRDVARTWQLPVSTADDLALHALCPDRPGHTSRLPGTTQPDRDECPLQSDHTPGRLPGRCVTPGHVRRRPRTPGG